MTPSHRPTTEFSKIARYLAGGGGGGPTVAWGPIQIAGLSFGGISDASALRYGYQAIAAAGIIGGGRNYGTYIPDEGWDPVAKTVIAEVISAVGAGELEQGVYDTAEPDIHPVFSGPGVEVEAPPNEVPDEITYGGGWPEDWKSGGGGWVDSDWVYPGEVGHSETVTEDDEVAIDWGGAVSGVIDILQGQQVGGGKYDVLYDVNRGDFATGGITGPAATKMTFDPATGKLTKCRRRRRRRLLTPTDLNDLAALKTIVGGGQAINFAVMKAVRR